MFRRPELRVARWGFRLLIGLLSGGLALVFLAYWAGSPPAISPSDLFGPPEAVLVEGYDDDLMEPFLTRDGEILFFNNRNDPAINTDLHWAVRVDDLHFRYQGLISGANSTALDGVPSMTATGELFFVSPRDYFQTKESVYCGHFASGTLTAPGVVKGLSRQEIPWLNFDVEISPDGRTLWTVDGWFTPIGFPLTADLLLAERLDTASGSFTRASDSARILAHVNSGALEYAAGISADGLELFFTRFGLPPFGREPKICLATRSATTDPFGPPVYLSHLDGFVEAPTLSPRGDLLYFHRRVGERFRLFLSRRRR